MAKSVTFTWTQQVQICINVHSVYCVVDGTFLKKNNRQNTYNYNLSSSSYATSHLTQDNMMCS